MTICLIILGVLFVEYLSEGKTMTQGDVDW